MFFWPVYNITNVYVKSFFGKIGIMLKRDALKQKIFINALSQSYTVQKVVLTVEIWSTLYIVLFKVLVEWTLFWNMSLGVIF